MATTPFEFQTSHGERCSGALAAPAGDGKAGAVILIQEWWGLNDHIKSIADRLAAEGFLVLAPDLYHGTITKDSAEAGKLMQSLDRTRALTDIRGAFGALTAHARVNERVGVIGFCMGGAFSFAAAATIPALACAVPFYGLPDPSLRFDQAKAPVQAHFSRTDGWATPAGAERIQAELAQHDVPMELFLYDAAHAFMNDTRPEVYSPDNAKLAWSRAIAFLKKHLG